MKRMQSIQHHCCLHGRTYGGSVEEFPIHSELLLLVSLTFLPSHVFSIQLLGFIAEVLIKVFNGAVFTDDLPGFTIEGETTIRFSKALRQKCKMFSCTDIFR